MTSVGLPPPHEWTLQAACRGLGNNPNRRDWLFPGPRNNAAIARAKRICKDCPVKRQCLDDDSGDLYSVRGGLTGDERRRMRAGTRPVSCTSCRLPFVPRPTNPTLCTGCTTRRSRVVPADFKEEIIAMHAEGMTGEEISLYFGFSRDEIRAAARAWRLPLMRRAAAECGSLPALAAHHRRRETPCRRCLQAGSEYRRTRRNKAVLRPAAA